MAKLTKQGLRDLNGLKGKSKGIKLEEPPIHVACKHRNKVTRYRDGAYWTYCKDCNEDIGEPW